MAGIKAGENEHDKAQALYSTLLSPVFNRDWDSLIVVPDGSLHLLPFQALQNEAGEYVVQRVAISVAPSATVLAALMREPDAGASKEFLGVAFSPATSIATADAPTRGIADIRGADIKPLRFSREEVTEADSALGGHGVILQGADASEAALKAQPLSAFRVIHFAAHGLGDEMEPDRAALVLAAGSASEDGLWQAREIPAYAIARRYRCPFRVRNRYWPPARRGRNYESCQSVSYGRGEERSCESLGRGRPLNSNVDGELLCEPRKRSVGQRCTSFIATGFH